MTVRIETVFLKNETDMLKISIAIHWNDHLFNTKGYV